MILIWVLPTLLPRPDRANPPVGFLLPPACNKDAENEPAISLMTCKLRRMIYHPDRRDGETIK